MSQKFNAARLEQLKTDAFENIDSYNDPDTPKALAAFTEQIKGVLQAAPDMLQSVPEYLPVALYGRVKFPGDAKLKWSQWLKTGNAPLWDEFKTTVAFNNADLPLVKTIRAYNESLLIEACAVLFMLSNETSSPVQRSQGSHDDGEGYEEDDDDYSDRRDQAADDYDGNDDEDEEGYDDQYDEITFKREGR
ncbi:hypothetical protein [Rheinheimera sp.]|uniref:cold adaptation protein AtcA n=1 Tax=Rheinheimera sp. TaxID=1869214 RepID=UPI0027B95F66|nr:hypothetical protein [Rheinheimera sp.]